MIEPSISDLTRKGAPETRARDARARRSMENLHEALVTLIELRPFEEITVDEIVEQAGVGRSTFYRHYADKDDLIDQLAQDEIDQLFDLTVPLLLQAGSWTSCLALANYVHERRRLWKALLAGGAVGVMREAFINRSTAKAIASAADDADLVVPASLAAACGVASTVEVLSWWLRQSNPVALEDIARYLQRLVVRPSFGHE